METGLCSSGSDFHALSKKFVCVRLYYTLEGASAPFAALGLGNPARPDGSVSARIKRNNADVAFLTPEGKPINLFRLRPNAKPSLGASELGCWVRDLPGGEEVRNGSTMVKTVLEVMREVSRLYPAKSDAPSTPWQVSLSHAIFVSAWDGRKCEQSRRAGRPQEWGKWHPRKILIAPTPGGQVDPGVLRSLGDAEVLRKYETHYVFVRLDAKGAPPELKDAMESAGSGGLVLLEEARTVDGFGQRQQGVPRTYPKVLEVKPGPHTKGSVLALLGKHVGGRSVR